VGSPIWPQMPAPPPKVPTLPSRTLLNGFTSKPEREKPLERSPAATLRQNALPDSGARPIFAKIGSRMSRTLQPVFEGQRKNYNSQHAIGARMQRKLGETQKTFALLGHGFQFRLRRTKLVIFPWRDDK
jgi:hypothetical protein